MLTFTFEYVQLYSTQMFTLGEKTNFANAFNDYV